MEGRAGRNVKEIGKTAIGNGIMACGHLRGDFGNKATILEENSILPSHPNKIFEVV